MNHQKLLRVCQEKFCMGSRLLAGLEVYWVKLSCERVNLREKQTVAIWRREGGVSERVPKSSAKSTSQDETIASRREKPQNIRGLGKTPEIPSSFHEAGISTTQWRREQIITTKRKGGE